VCMRSEPREHAAQPERAVEPRPSDPASESVPRQALRIGFGILWLFDALLQLQPGMFQMDMISDIMQPAATGEPIWLAHTINLSIAVVTPHLVVFNLVVVALQAAIGILLLTGRVRVGAWLAVVWSALVWWFGEGLGQLLTGSATFLSGAPGSVFLYGLAAVLLLLPDETWWVGVGGRRHLPVPAALAAAMFLLGAGLEANPLFFTGLGLASPFGQGAMMSQPHAIQATLGWMANLSGSAPVWLNVAWMVMMLGLGSALFFAPGAKATLYAALAFLFVVWWFGQDVGGLLTGMATDPNTAVPLALLAWAGFLMARHPRAPQRGA